MKKASNTVLAIVASCATVALVSARQVNVRSFFDSSTGAPYSESMYGDPVRVDATAVPEALKFQVIEPGQKVPIVKASSAWWKFPKTTKRSEFAVAEISYRDPKNPAGTILVLQWKHSSGISAFNGRGLPQTTILGSGPLNPIVGTKDGKDVACYFENLPIDRAIELTRWIPIDGKGPNTWGVSELEQSRMVLMRREADANAKNLAVRVQGKAIQINKYDPIVDHYASDLGGSIPVNPCTGTSD